MDIIKYKVIITPTAYREMDRIYEYIAEVLFAKDAAKRLMQQVEEKIKKLEISPKIYEEVEKFDELKKRYRKIVIENFIVLYTIDEENNIVYVSNMYYGKKDYLK